MFDKSFFCVIYSIFCTEYNDCTKVFEDVVSYRKGGHGYDEKERRGMIYYIQGSDLCCVDHWGKQRRLARLPRGQVTAFTHVSADGTKICVPTTDAAALECREGEYFVDNKPNYDIDERVRREASAFLSARV